MQDLLARQPAAGAASVDLTGELLRLLRELEPALRSDGAVALAVQVLDTLSEATQGHASLANSSACSATRPSPSSPASSRTRCPRTRARPPPSSSCAARRRRSLSPPRGRHRVQAAHAREDGARVQRARDPLRARRYAQSERARRALRADGEAHPPRRARLRHVSGHLHAVDVGATALLHAAVVARRVRGSVRRPRGARARGRRCD